MSTLIAGIVTSTIVPQYEKEQVVVFQAYSDGVEAVLDRNGEMWVIGDDEGTATQVNFCPFTGREAKVKRSDYVPEENDEYETRQSGDNSWYE